MRSDGFGIFTVYGRISVMDLHFWESLASQKGKGRRATSTGRTQGEGALRSDVTVLTSDGSDLRQLECGEFARP